MVRDARTAATSRRWLHGFRARDCRHGRRRQNHARRRGEIDKDSVRKTQTTAFAFCFLCVFCGLAAAQTAPEPAERHRYKIDLKIDIEHLAYTGTETVRWINRGEKPTNVIYFHLYPNLRTTDQQPLTNTETPDADEPRLDVIEVRAARDNAPLFSSLDDQGTTIRVNLREPVASGGAAEVTIGFKGKVPEIDRDETSLTTHVVKQVSAALRSDRETRRARDINFLCRGVMLLGAAYPAQIGRAHV